MSLPDTFRTPHKMARVLASYIDCPRRIRSEVLACFLTAPHVSTIAEYRREHLRPKRDEIEPCQPHDGYWPDEASRQAERANREYVRRLTSEKARVG